MTEQRERPGTLIPARAGDRAAGALMGNRALDILFTIAQRELADKEQFTALSGYQNIERSIWAGTTLQWVEDGRGCGIRIRSNDGEFMGVDFVNQADGQWTSFSDYVEGHVEEWNEHIQRLGIPGEQVFALEHVVHFALKKTRETIVRGDDYSVFPFDGFFP